MKKLSSTILPPMDLLNSISNKLEPILDSINIENFENLKNTTFNFNFDINKWKYFEKFYKDYTTVTPLELQKNQKLFGKEENKENIVKYKLSIFKKIIDIFSTLNVEFVYNEKNTNEGEFFIDTEGPKIEFNLNSIVYKKKMGTNYKTGFENTLYHELQHFSQYLINALRNGLDHVKFLTKSKPGYRTQLQKGIRNYEDVSDNFGLITFEDKKISEGMFRRLSLNEQDLFDLKLLDAIDKNTDNLIKTIFINYKELSKYSEDIPLVVQTVKKYIASRKNFIKYFLNDAEFHTFLTVFIKKIKLELGGKLDNEKLKNILNNGLNIDKDSIEYGYNGWLFSIKRNSPEKYKEIILEVYKNIKTSKGCNWWKISQRSYLDIGHYGPLSPGNDYSDRNLNRYVVLWVWDGNSLQTRSGKNEKTHGDYAIEDPTFKLLGRYAGRYDSNTGKLSISIPPSKSRHRIPESLINQLKYEFNPKEIFVSGDMEFYKLEDW